MPRTIMLIPTRTSVGLTSISLGIIHAMQKKSAKIQLFKPIAQTRFSEDTFDSTVHIIQTNSAIPCIKPLSMSHVESYLASNQRDTLIEELVAVYDENAKKAEVVLIEGLEPTQKHHFAMALNYEIARALNAEIVFVLSLKNYSLDQFQKHIELICSGFGERGNKNIIGIIINKLNEPVDKEGCIRLYPSKKIFAASSVGTSYTDQNLLFKNSPLPILGCIPWNCDLIATRAIDMAYRLNATIIHEGEIKKRRVKSITFCTCNLLSMLEDLCLGSLLVVSADRPDALIAACLATMNGIEISAILLTGGCKIDPRIKELCSNAFQTGLPVFAVRASICQTFLDLQNLNLEVPADDHRRVKKLQSYIASYIDNSWVQSLFTHSKRPHRMSPPSFRYHLTKLARRIDKRIVLPEGEEPRTIKAVSICAERGIARCVLIGNPDKINYIAAVKGIILNDMITIIDPKLVREKYIPRLIELRKKRGMTAFIAREQLKDNVVLGTLMLEQDEVDGMVSGTIHTTANTIRPPLQLIKTAPGNSLVSSVFFMLLPEQVLVYSDCAINPDPTAEQLAEIALQSADSAAAFGIEPRVAMLSYSTGNSGAGSAVEKVRKATDLAKVKRPDLIIDGPLQYDAAIMADVALSKAPNSPIAGQATVFVFPDLNSGNITYKAVQRAAGLISIGPMLQGMRKPVNDLSRGALINDIVYTIALTAIQSQGL